MPVSRKTPVRWVLARGPELLAECEHLHNPRGLLSVGAPKTVEDHVCYALNEAGFSTEEFAWRTSGQKGTQEIWAVPATVPGMARPPLHDTGLRVVDRWEF